MTANVEQPELIQSLLHPDVYNHPVKTIQLIETHISWVILTGDFTYKIKKPCNLGFLDFSTLEDRHFYCNEELRLNRRLAAPLYLEVVAITGRPNQPILHGTSNIIEYAVKMVQFPQQAQLDNKLAAGELTQRHMDAIAHMAAEFHRNIATAPPDSRFGSPKHVLDPVTQTYTRIKKHLSTQNYDKPLTELENWHKTTFESLVPIFEQRKRNGFIRECHGDLHLRNLVWLDNRPLAFDCLEFDPDLRWIDTLSEIAFLAMDLQDRKQGQLAQRFLNSYLEQCGDYSGMSVFRFYLVYRALVRAMVNAIRAGQPGLQTTEKQASEIEFQNYLNLALNYVHHAQPALIITRGFSGSGKSTLSQPLLASMGAIRIRSDIERKRLFGIAPDDDSKAATGEGIYTEKAGIKTYAKLKTLANDVLNAGFPVIIDAAFLKYTQRKPFLELAYDKQLPFIILEFTASNEILRQRIQARQLDISDADLSILEHQLATTESLHDNELHYRIVIDTEKKFDAEHLALKIAQNGKEFVPTHLNSAP